MSSSHLAWGLPYRTRRKHRLWYRSSGPRRLLAGSLLARAQYTDHFRPDHAYRDHHPWPNRKPRPGWGARRYFRYVPVLGEEFSLHAAIKCVYQYQVYNRKKKHRIGKGYVNEEPGFQNPLFAIMEIQNVF